MALFHHSHNKALGLTLGTILLLVLFPVLFKVIFAAKDEISLAASAGVSTCEDFYIDEESELSRCTSTYNISLGNTGSSHQELISIELTSVPENHRLSWNSLDIVATNREAIIPRIQNQHLGDTLQIEVRDLQPNRLIEIRVSSQGIDAARQMENISISVLAEGTIVETNPRTTVILRFLRNLGGIFGF